MTLGHLEEFALEGLRTLMVGIKDMSDEEFAQWDEVGRGTTVQRLFGSLHVSCLCCLKISGMSHYPPTQPTVPSLLTALWLGLR